jgi:type III pantothenate kinase
VAAREAQCGVRNGYSNVSRLGSDRWAALIAAWHLIGGSCLVVNSGTATTVDALSGKGEFTGGLILPGVELMQRSLCTATAQLQAGQGEYAAFPRNTADALFSGAIQASCGAIERQHALLDDDGAPVLLSGGAAGVLRAHLNLPLRIVDNLVLHGLLLIAQESGA